jgi:hypothetical protein
MRIGISLQEPKHVFPFDDSVIWQFSSGKSGKWVSSEFLLMPEFFFNALCNLTKSLSQK